MPEDPFDDLKNGSIVGKRYKVKDLLLQCNVASFQVMQKLGEGGCGSVFKVEDIEDKNQQYALKVEFNSANAGNVLKMEVQILSLMISKKHVAKCVASGKKPTYSYMVMTLLGESLDSIVRKHGPFLNVSSQVRIGICVLFGIKQIHDIGYIHRDLKPANVALGCVSHDGNPNSSIFFQKGSADERYFLVLDFGLARQYVTDEQDGKKMRRPREKALFRGTARYCSVAMHDRFEQGRTDDLWTLVYMLAELRCQLAWHDVEDKVEIGDMKRAISDADLFAKSPIQMLEFVKIVRGTQFYHRPDYEKLFKLLDDVMKNADYKWTDPYHWEPDKKRTPSSNKKLSFGLGRKGSAGGTPTKDSAEGGGQDVAYFTAVDFTSNPIGF
ncbi:hypothetical protein CRE_03895 [Caenorhabditis remanei]|uniref:Protein kinase domain-containing protein n=1 Tax=Caenorhabditis remanei TaxID=31234 RepID=E3LXP9_CAERE|nr:hypothetical protein CRE_03895 [Caenorhabditis remanei]